MSRFVNRQATDEIALANGDKVWVRQKLTASERAELDKRLFSFKFNAQAERAEDRVTAEAGDYHRRRIDLAKAYIVRWNFTDDNGKDVPYQAELVEELDSDTVDEIVEAIDALQAKRGEDIEKKDLKPSAK